MFEELEVVEFQNIDEYDEDDEFYPLVNGVVGTIVHVFPPRMDDKGLPIEETYYIVEYDIKIDGPSKLATVPEHKIKRHLYKK